MEPFDRAAAAHHTLMARRALTKIARYITDCPSDEVALELIVEQFAKLQRQTERLWGVMVLAQQATPVTPAPDPVDDEGVGIHRAEEGHAPDCPFGGTTAACTEIAGCKC